jgi:hypothetical protein
MSPEAAVAAAMIALVQPDTEGGKKRLETIATAIVDEARPVAFWGGDSGLTATGLMLVAIGFHESKFNEKTRRCLPRPGKYIGLYQILPGPNTRPHSVKDVCASDALQAKLALAVLARTLERCPSCSPVHAMRAYASGSVGVDSKEAREITNLWHRAALSVGLTVFPYSREQPRVAQR